jgi:hypothetical protein
MNFWQYFAGYGANYVTVRRMESMTRRLRLVSCTVTPADWSNDEFVMLMPVGWLTGTAGTEPYRTVRL